MVGGVALLDIGIEVDHRTRGVDLLTEIVERVLRVCHLKEWGKVLCSVPPTCTSDGCLIHILVTIGI